jgi:predicted 3-demethylubiquinone-9 3-methyltransferase (glyoxalase superfamily)
VQKITPFLWFDDKAEEAANFYVSIFKNSKIIEVSKYDEDSAKMNNKEVGSAMIVSFELEGQEFNAINGGDQGFRFNESISFVIKCESQEEIDSFWEKFGEGGKEIQCGWITDRFGLTWQVIPANMQELLSDADPVKAKKAVQAMLQMKKIDISALKQAKEGS